MPIEFPEYGRLRKVLMHSPGEEIDRITPASYRRNLFEDAIESARFRAQHEQLVDLLRKEGVDVALVANLLRGSTLLNVVSNSPNLVYMRDAVAVTRAGRIRMRMRSPVRRREPEVAAAALDRLGVPRLMDVQAPATMEGGDLIFLDEETLLVGVGNRTNQAGLRLVWERMRAWGLRTVIAIELPRWAIHLDGTMMIIDQDLAVIHRESLGGSALVYEAAQRPKPARPLRLLAQRGIRIIEVTAYERQRRATNLITLGPRKVIGYAGNARVRSLLTKEGVDVLEIEGSELVRGGGGPRCMTAPIARDASGARIPPRVSTEGES